MDISAILADLSTCLCAQILTDDLPPVCVCGVLPGDEVALDYAGDCDDACGMAWVRLTTAYPSVSVGVPTGVPGNCTTAIGVEIEMGIVRCLDVGEGGTPPEFASLTASAVLQVADMMAMWRAVHCCQNARDFIIGQYVPIGPQGGLIGGTLPLGMLVL